MWAVQLMFRAHGRKVETVLTVKQMDDYLAFDMENDVPRWLKIISESVKVFIGIVALIGGIIALPYTKNKIEEAGKKADSTLTLLNSIQTQLQIQTQQQTQKQGQIQGQGQKQEQSMSNVQQTEVYPSVLPDTAKKLSNIEEPIDSTMNVPCNRWTSVPQSHDAEFKIECLENIYDSVRIYGRFLGANNSFDSIATIGQERVFTDQNGSFALRQLHVEFVEFWDKSPTHLYPKVRVKLVEENRITKWKKF